MSKINCELLVHFVEASESNAFRAHFKIGRLYVQQFLNWIILSTSIPAENRKRDESQGVSRFNAVASSSVRVFSYFNLLEIGTEQIRQVLRASLDIVMYVKQNPRVRALHYTLIRTKQIFGALINGASFCRLFQTLHVEALLLRWTL